MKTFEHLGIFSLAAGLMANAASAQEAPGLDDKINQAFADLTGPFVSFIFAPFPGTGFPWIVGWLVVAATVFSLYFAFVQFRFFSHAISLVKGDYSDPNDAGEVSHSRRWPQPFQARSVWAISPVWRLRSASADQGPHSG